MFNIIKKWYCKRKQEKYITEWLNGYDWAAGVLLRKEETPLSIEAIYGHDSSAFDLGVYTAIDTILRLKVSEDSDGGRIYGKWIEKAKLVLAKARGEEE